MLREAPPASGLVAGQSPAAGTQVQPNTPVNLQVSTGPCTAVVPSVVGSSQSQAVRPPPSRMVSGLSAAVAMIDCKLERRDPAGTVQSQTPAGGLDGEHAGHGDAQRVQSIHHHDVDQYDHPTTAADHP